MNNIWKWIDGNKTIICGVIFGFIARFGVQLGIPIETVDMILWIAGALGAGSFTHHVTKQVKGAKK
jgi:hypothetical protein